MNVFKRWFPLAILTTCLCGILYVSLQQSLRLGANDPQIQLAEDTASKLSTDSDTVQITSIPRVDMRKSLSSFVITFDASGKVVSSSGDILGKIPVVPVGVFAYAREHEDDRFTWEPQSDVRIAAVVRHYTGRTTGYVLAGRSLREVEKREELLMHNILLGWAVTLVVLFAVVLITTSPDKKKK